MICSVENILLVTDKIYVDTKMVKERLELDYHKNNLNSCLESSSLFLITNWSACLITSFSSFVVTVRLKSDYLYKDNLTLGVYM